MFTSCSKFHEGRALKGGARSVSCAGTRRRVNSAIRVASLGGRLKMVWPGQKMLCTLEGN